MRIRNTTVLFISVISAVFYVASPGHLRAQAQPGPIHPIQAPDQAQAQAPAQPKQEQPKRLTLYGFWKLNQDQSDDARKKIQEANQGNNGGYGGNGPYGGSRRMGGGFPFPGTGGQGPYGGGRGGMGGGGSDTNRQQMEELANPANSLTLAQKDSEVDLTDDQGRERAFYTDGRKLNKSNDDKYQEFAAHWEGSRLVSEQKSSGGRKITRTFELAPSGQQLDETVTLDNGRSSSPVVIHYVYDAAQQNAN